MENIELEILGLASSLTSNNNTYALILKELHGTRRLPVIIGAYEAQAIALELENFKRQRPLTHDLFADALKTLNTYLEKIIIDNIKEGIFYATIYLNNQGNIIKLDARPSDAVAMAVRFKCPIFVKEQVLEEAGVSVKEEDYAEEDFEISHASAYESNISNRYASNPQEIYEQIQRLNKEIEEAILHEDYERAAKLRDEIKKLENKKE